MLKAEQGEDEAVLKERLSTWSLTRLEEEGYCLTGLSAYWLEENQFGRPVASFLLGPGLALSEHRFESGSSLFFLTAAYPSSRNGTQVLLSRIDPLRESFAQGSVISRSTTQIRIAFRDHFDELDTGIWRIDVGRSNIAYERMRDAIGQLNHDPQQLEAAAMSSDRELILQGTHLRDILLRTSEPDNGNSLGNERTMKTETETALVADEDAVSDEQSSAIETDGAFKDDQRIHSWARRYSQVNPLVVAGDPVLDGLNDTQVRAMALMIGQRVSLVQGVGVFVTLFVFSHVVIRSLLGRARPKLSSKPSNC
jgi:hypothetical protein